MKTEKELREELARIEADERLTYKAALVQVNAPLALEQMGLSTRANMLRWVLGLPLKTYCPESDIG